MFYKIIFLAMLLSLILLPINTQPFYLIEKSKAVKKENIHNFEEYMFFPMKRFNPIIPIISAEKMLENFITIASQTKATGNLTPTKIEKVMGIKFYKRKGLHTTLYSFNESLSLDLYYYLRLEVDNPGRTVTPILGSYLQFHVDNRNKSVMYSNVDEICKINSDKFTNKLKKLGFTTSELVMQSQPIHPESRPPHTNIYFKYVSPYKNLKIHTVTQRINLKRCITKVTIYEMK